MNQLEHCPDCAVSPGEIHQSGCDVARCTWTGHQKISCDGAFADIVCQLRSDGHDQMADDLAYHLSIDDEQHDCGADVWTGVWPGEADAMRLGFYCYGPPWVECGPEHPDSRPNLNKLNEVFCRWDRVRKRWEHLT